MIFMMMDGKLVKLHLLEELAKKIKCCQRPLTLAVLLAGDSEASKIYIRRKENLALTLGITVSLYSFSNEARESEVIACIQKLNEDKNVDGILVQLPLPPTFDVQRVINSISAEKDVDGLTSNHQGRLLQNQPCIIPCTAMAVFHLLQFYQVSLASQNVVIIGRSNLVSKPLACLLTNHDATVTVCHSKTKNLVDFTRMADIIVVAVGKPKFLKGEMIKEGAIIIDVGIHRESGKIVGDVDVDSVQKKCRYLSKVPGGVGELTVYMVMENLYTLYKNQEKQKNIGN